MAEHGGMSHAPATELDEQLIQAALQTAEPVTVRLYGVKEITLPAYLLLLAATVIVVSGLVAVSAEVVSPRTAFGERAQRIALSEPGTLELALWTPPLLLVGLAFEVLECAVVVTAFRRKFHERDERVRHQLLSFGMNSERESNSGNS